MLQKMKEIESESKKAYEDWQSIGQRRQNLLGKIEQLSSEILAKEATLFTIIDDQEIIAATNDIALLTAQRQALQAATERVLTDIARAEKIYHQERYKIFARILPKYEQRCTELVNEMDELADRLNVKRKELDRIVSDVTALQSAVILPRDEQGPIAGRIDRMRGMAVGLKKAWSYYLVSVGRVNPVNVNDPLLD